LVEKAGGITWDGRTGSILDVPITDMDMRVPFFAGNYELVEKFKEFYGQGI
jgi:fructose-1,6-bisphosphatase